MDAVQIQKKKKKGHLRRRKKFYIDLECLGLKVFGRRDSGATKPGGNPVRLKEWCQKSSWISSLRQEEWSSHFHCPEELYSQESLEQSEWDSIQSANNLVLEWVWFVWAFVGQLLRDAHFVTQRSPYD